MASNQPRSGCSIMRVVLGAIGWPRCSARPVKAPGAGNRIVVSARAPPNALGVVWVCLGLPALLRVDWLFGRGLWLMHTVSAGLSFGAMLLPADHRYGYLLRIVATFVVAASLLVWRTLWRLTSAPAARAAAGPST